MNDLVLNAEHLESLRELTEPGEPDLLSELIGLFVDQSTEILGGIKEGLDEKNCDKIEKWAHKLKGSGANLGAVKLASLCEVMEDKGCKKDLSGTSDLYTKIEAAYAEALAALQKDWLKAA